MTPPSSEHACRPGCGACCIAPSITSAIPGMPLGKPAGVRCVQLDDDNRCASLRLGATHFLEKPVSLETLAHLASTAGVPTAMTAAVVTRER